MSFLPTLLNSVVGCEQSAQRASEIKGNASKITNFNFFSQFVHVSLFHATQTHNILKKKHFKSGISMFFLCLESSSVNDLRY